MTMLRRGLAAEFPFATRAVDQLNASVRSLHVLREAPIPLIRSGPVGPNVLLSGAAHLRCSPV